MKGQIYPTKYGYQVRFGRKLTKHFKNLGDAERFLNGIRFKMDEGTFDIRDYQRGNPMGFQNLAEKWLDMKFQTLKTSGPERSRILFFMIKIFRTKQDRT